MRARREADYQLLQFQKNRFAQHSSAAPDSDFSTHSSMNSVEAERAPVAMAQQYAPTNRKPLLSTARGPAARVHPAPPDSTILLQPLLTRFTADEGSHAIENR
jgi:hypothetical protein